MHPRMLTSTSDLRAPMRASSQPSFNEYGKLSSVLYPGNRLMLRKNGYDKLYRQQTGNNKSATKY